MARGAEGKVEEEVERWRRKKEWRGWRDFRTNVRWLRWGCGKGLDRGVEAGQGREQGHGEKV